MTIQTHGDFLGVDVHLSPDESALYPAGVGRREGSLREWPGGGGCRDRAKLLFALSRTRQEDSGLGRTIDRSLIHLVLAAPR